MKYKKIIRPDTDAVQSHTTIRGMKLAMRQGKVKEGVFHCYCPNGNIHTWEIKQSGTHTCAGSTGTKGKIGKGVVLTNYAAQLKSVVHA